MANILDILNEIGTAIYGRDVRQAIIDAIRQCYEDGKAGVNDLQARTLIEAVMAVNEQQAAEIETLTARVEELEEGGSGGSSETSTTSVPTFLVESGTATFENVGANKTATQSIAFTKNFTEAPTVLAIKIFRQGANTFYSQVTAQPIQNSITTTGFTLAIGNKYTQAVSPSVLWVAFQPTTVEVETEITTVDGMTEADVRALLAPITAALDSLKIGYDGTEYDTAGGSLRDQINALHVLIGDEPGTAISASAVAYGEDSDVETALDEVKSRLTEQEEIVDALNEGGLDIKDEVIEAQITEWLNDHPEATTTVQDGAISEAKLASALKPKIMNTYVTPEMYGAVGDGVTDDTSAIRSAFATGKAVSFTKGRTYAVSAPITVSTPVEITNGTVIKAIAEMQSVFIITAPSDSFRFIGGTINCNQLADYGIYADTLGGAYIQNVKVVDAVEACIYINGGYHNWITNCKLYNNNTLATGIYNKSADLKVIGTEIYYTTLAIDQRSGILFVSTSHFWSGGASNLSETSTAIKITISSSGMLARVFLTDVYFDSFYQCIFTERTAHIKASSCLFYWAATTTPNSCYGLVVPTNSIWKLSACMFQTVDSVTVTDILYNGYGLRHTEPQTSVASLFTTPQATQVVFNAHVKDGFLYIDFVLDITDITQDDTHQVPIIVSEENLPYWTFQRMDGAAYNLTQHNAIPLRLIRSASTGIITIHCAEGLNVGDRIQGGISVQLRG